MTRDRAGAPPLFVSGQFRGRSDADRVVNYSSPILVRRITLDPGHYRVYLIADEKPARVSFTFDRGLTGSRRLQPFVTTHAEAATSDDFTEAAGAAGFLHGSNEHAVTTDETLAVNMLAIHGGDEILEGAGVCIKDLEATIHLDYYGPRCSGDEKVFVAQASTRADTYFMFLEDHGVTRGRWGFGGWYGGDTAPEYVGLHMLTIDRP